MSIATAITNAQGKVADAYTAVSNKGGTLPATQNLSNLPTAISSIPTSSGSVEVKQYSSSVNPVFLISGTSAPYTPSSALNRSNDVTITTGTYTLWYADKKTLVATINL